MANKVKFGLRNVVYSKITIGENGKYEYATPVAIPGAVNVDLSASGDTSDFYADDSIYFSDTVNQGYEGDLEIALIPESFLIDIMGQTRDKNGALIENADAKTSSFALGFQIDGDKSGRKVWFYNCTAARPNQAGSTKESGITPSTDTLSLKAMPRLSDKEVKVVIELNETNTTIYNNFFEQVYEKNTDSI